MAGTLAEALVIFNRLNYKRGRARGPGIRFHGHLFNGSCQGR